MPCRVIKKQPIKKKKDAKHFCFVLFLKSCSAAGRMVVMSQGSLHSSQMTSREAEQQAVMMCCLPRRLPTLCWPALTSHPSTRHGSDGGQQGLSLRWSCRIWDQEPPLTQTLTSNDYPGLTCTTWAFSLPPNYSPPTDSGQRCLGSHPAAFCYLYQKCQIN